MDTKTSSQTPASKPNCKEQRHSLYLVPDGDIVISAPTAHDPSTMLLFRLETLSLRYHSQIFRDMLSLPGDASTNELYDGVPRVRLTDDAWDLAGLLKAMNNPASLPLKRSDPDAIPNVTGIMRLAVKYEAHAVRKLILQHLEAEWNCSLLEWERRRQIGTHAYESIGIDPKMHTFLAASLPEPASAVRFGLDFKVPKLLPVALYELAFTPRSNDWYTWETHPGQYSGLMYVQVFADRYARWNLLQEPELHVIMKGKDEVLSEWTTFLANLDQAADPSKCFFWQSVLRKLRCKQHFEEGFRAWFTKASLPGRTPGYKFYSDDDDDEEEEEEDEKPVTHHIPDDPLTLAKSLCQALSAWNLCECCRSKYQTRVQEWAGYTWDMLPRYFRIPVPK